MTAPSKTPEAAGLEVVAWVSEEQLAAHTDRPESPTGGRYLPVRKTRAGLFTQGLVTAASTQAAIDAEKARADRLAKALEPFAAMADAGDQRPKDDAVWAGQDGVHITYGDFRAARAALQQETQP